MYLHLTVSLCFLDEKISQFISSHLSSQSSHSSSIPSPSKFTSSSLNQNQDQDDEDSIILLKICNQLTHQLRREFKNEISTFSQLSPHSLGF